VARSVALAVALLACSAERAPIDAGADAATRTVRFQPVRDGLDVASLVDAGLVDAGLVDAGLVDAGLVDAGELDAGLVDAGELDAGLVDAGVNACGSTGPLYYPDGSEVTDGRGPGDACGQCGSEPIYYRCSDAGALGCSC